MVHVAFITSQLHCCRFANLCVFGEKAFPQGRGRTKKDAKTEAARITFSALLGGNHEGLRGKASHFQHIPSRVHNNFWWIFRLCHLVHEIIYCGYFKTGSVAERLELVTLVDIPQRLGGSRFEPWFGLVFTSGFFSFHPRSIPRFLVCF